MTLSERVSSSPMKSTAGIKFMYKIHNNYSLQLLRWILIPIGAWPRTNATTKMQRMSSFVHILTCLSLITIIIVPCMLHVWLEEKDLEVKLNIIGPLCHWTMGMINYCLLLMRADQICECVRHMETDWKIVQRIEDREMMMRHARIGRFVAGFCALFMQSGTFLFSIAKSVSTTIIVIGNETVTMHPMTCPIYSKFIDTRYSPANEIMQVVHMTSAFIVNSVAVGVCSLDAVLAMHACGQLKILFSWLNGVIAAGNKAEQRLAIIVEHHLRVLSFISRMETVMQHICLVELLGCTLCMCLLAYYFITNGDTFDMAKTISYVMIYLSYAFNIFLFCYIGEILTEQCKTVGEKAYMIHWYQLPRKTALELVLIIARSNNIIKITAGKFVQLSVTTFGDVIKTSMVYLNMLRTMRHSA